MHLDVTIDKVSEGFATEARDVLWGKDLWNTRRRVRFLGFHKFSFLLISFQCQWSCLANEGFSEAHMFVDSSFVIIRPVTRKSVKSTRRWKTGKLPSSFDFSDVSKYWEMAERNIGKLSIRFSRYQFTKPLPSNGRPLWLYNLIRGHTETHKQDELVNLRSLFQNKER
jgi:hypothetical protein